MKKFTVKDIDNLGTCYSASRYLSDGWSGTVLDILDVEDCPPEDRLYVVRKSLQLSDKVLRLFAVECAKKAQTYPKNYTPDLRTLKAIEVAERFVHGQATDEERTSARRAAYAAADAAYAAAYAAYAAADAAYAAAYAAYAAAYAAYAAADAAYAAADDAARHRSRLWQVEKLKELIKEFM